MRSVNARSIWFKALLLFVPLGTQIRQNGMAADSKPSVKVIKITASIEATVWIAVVLYWFLIRRWLNALGAGGARWVAGRS